MKRTILLCLIVACVAACAAPERITGTGQRAEPPAGWADYCRRHPEDKSC